MKLRDAKSEDLGSITNLILICSEKFILPGLSDEGRQNYLQSHSLGMMKERLDQFHYQVLQEGDKIIGLVGMRRPSHLFHLHVSPEYHEQGLGRKLWTAAMNKAIQVDGPDVFTVNSSVYAVQFYEKLGFVASARENRGGVEYVPMSKKIISL